MEKDKTEVGITGQPVPKPKTATQQYKLEKKRRMRKHLGKNVGGTQYSSDVNPYLNPRSVREEVLSYLLDEGFASDEKSAEAIMGAMSEAWIDSIMEGPGGMMMSAASRGQGSLRASTPPSPDPRPRNPNEGGPGSQNTRPRLTTGQQMSAPRSTVIKNTPR